MQFRDPLALKAMQKLTATPVEDMEYYTFKVLEFAGIKDVIFSTTGYTGAGGCEIYVKNEDGPKLWKAVFEAGKEFDIKPIGLGARDTCVLKWVFASTEMILMIRHHLSKQDLGWITKFTDEKDFIDKALLLKQKEEGVAKETERICNDRQGNTTAAL